MLNQDKQNGSVGISNQENQPGKISIAPKDNSKGLTVLEKKLSIPRAGGSKHSDQSSQSYEETRKSGLKVASENKFIEKDNYGAVDPTIDILEEETNKRDKSYDSNKSGKNSSNKSKERGGSKQPRIASSKERSNSKNPVGKKQVRFSLESKGSGVGMVISGELATEDTQVNVNEINYETKGSTNTNSVESTAKPTEKKTLKSEMLKRGDTFHQRTNTMYTNLLVDSKGTGKGEESKKTALSSIGNALKLPPKTPRDLKPWDAIKNKPGGLSLGNYNTVSEKLNIKVPMTPRVNLVSFNQKNNLTKMVEKKEPELPVVKEVKKEVFRKIKLFHQMSQAGWNPHMKKPNQDISFVCPNFADDQNTLFLSVCDGHGTYGHDVSAFLEQTLPDMVSKELKEKIKNDNINYPKIFERSFQVTNVKLKNDLYVDSSLSGSTCVSVMYRGDRLICANIGDSRAVVGKCVDGKWIHHDLSRDHKPTDKDEGERIKRRGGRVEQAKKSNGDYHGPMRVWLPNENIPGIAMSRSFGDEVAAGIGVIAEPEVQEYPLSENDKFLIMATDGIWEFITSEECINIIKDFYINNDIEGALPFLIKESSERWIKEENLIDDTTVILVFFE